MLQLMTRKKQNQPYHHERHDAQRCLKRYFHLCRIIHQSPVVIYTNNMHITILGRQPALGMAELECLYGSSATRWFSDESALVESRDFDFERLGGSQKAGRVVAELSGDWRRASMQIVKAYSDAWKSHKGKITLGISAYGFRTNSRDVQKTGIILKQKLRGHGVSLRLIPNAEPALNTATSHHNKLGLSDNHVELLVVRASNGKVIIAESVGAQNITALAARDQARPKTDAFVGMLPPKLARMMINIAGGANPLSHKAVLTPRGATSDATSPLSVTSLAPSPNASSETHDAREMTTGQQRGNNLTVLDPFCGTGVVLQEAALLGYNAYGSDLSEKMVSYSTHNLDWLTEKYSLSVALTIEQGDAMSHRWQKPIDVVVCESYLGQPFSAPPSPAKLTEVRGNCNHIISEFLKNIVPQLAPGTPLCVAVPAWRDSTGRFTHLPFIHALDKLGYEHVNLSHVKTSELLYYRESQVVARELLLLKKK